MTADDSSGTGTDTSSDDGMETLDITVNMVGTEHEVQERVYWLMRNAKRQGRRSSHKLVRKVRLLSVNEKEKAREGKGPMHT